jgi:hypothetical protein
MLSEGEGVQVVTGQVGLVKISLALLVRQGLQIERIKPRGTKLARWLLGLAMDSARHEQQKEGTQANHSCEVAAGWKFHRLASGCRPGRPPAPRPPDDSLVYRI